MIILSDDGTMDTVLVCTECREEFRYNYEGVIDDKPDDERSDEQHYAEFVKWSIADAEEEHECGEDK